MKSDLNRRWVYLALGVASMLFAGMIYAWSILKAPFALLLGLSVGALVLNLLIKKP